MDTFRIPLVWQMYGHCYVEANSIKDAIEIALGPNTPLPDGSYIGSAEKVKFSECIRNGSKKVAYFRGQATIKIFSGLILHTDIWSSCISTPQNQGFYGKTPDFGVIFVLEKEKNQNILQQIKSFY